MAVQVNVIERLIVEREADCADLGPVHVPQASIRQGEGVWT